jgi:hypothetical protein
MRGKGFTASDTPVADDPCAGRPFGFTLRKPVSGVHALVH